MGCVLRFVIVSFLLALPVLPYAQNSREYRLTPEVNALLIELDSLLMVSDDINEAKLEHISQIRSAYNKATELDRRYWFAAELYDEYCAFDSDSAMMYADRAYELARMLDRNDLMEDMELNRAYIYSATGLLREAFQCIENVDETKLSPNMLWKYCDRVLFLSTHRDLYIGVESRQTIYPAVVDSLLQDAMPHIKPDDPHYCWFVGWAHLKDKSEAERVIPIVKEIVDKSNFSTRIDAMNAWVLSKLYEYSGDYALKLKYLILSAMADVRASNKEIASLEEVAEILYQLGDLERSNVYINYSMACATAYKSRVRQGPLAKLQERTFSAIIERSEKQASLNRRYMILIIIVLIVLVLAFVYIVRQMRELKRSREALHGANEELRSRVDELQLTREELNETNQRLSDMYAEVKRSASELSTDNEAKEKYIASVFAICSNYINKLDDFRKNIYRMIVAHRYEEMLDLTKSPELSHGEIKELYANFDSIFLGIYPDFVDDFNALLRPEEKIELRNPGQLTTELRIYALVRLGINDSVKIAQFLHVSVQTVYNTRQRTRNKAAIPKEQFAETVKSLGKAAF